MNIYEAMIDRAKNNQPITLNLLLTTQCNLACRHCFFGCSPKGSAARPDLGIAYISNEVLFAAKNMIEFLNNLEIDVNLNLIGGEPTLKLERFTEIIEIISHWTFTGEISMVTNGWWLARPETAKKFFYAVRSLVDTSGSSEDGGLSVRISNDKWHTEWRKHPLMKDITSLWNDSEYGEWVCESYEMYCINCGHTQEAEDVCEECGGDCLSRDWDSFIVPEPTTDSPWIHIEKDTWYEPIQSGYCQVSGGEMQCTSNHHMDLSFEPDGALMDVCCRGSYLRAGTIHDDPIELLCLAEMFMTDKKPSCKSCLEDAADWVEERLEAAKIFIQRAKEQYET